MATSSFGALLRSPTAQSVSLTIPEGCLVSDHFTAVAGQELVAAKVQHIHKVGTSFGLAIGGTPAGLEEVIFVASTAGTINKFAALLNDSGTSTSVTFDLKKNGTTVLTGVVTVVHGTGDRVPVEGTLASASFVAGDVFSVALAVTSTTGAQGPFAWAEFIETKD